MFVFRLLEAQLQTQSRQHKDELEALHTQIELLKDNLEKKQEVLDHFSTLSPDALVEFSVQQEITRLTNENLVRPCLRNNLCTNQHHCLLFGRGSRGLLVNPLGSEVIFGPLR